ncbi:DUF5691 domain-containing protein [Streptomyces montanisoli]|uniref:Uncharacterized protein n=1 Tax=Streptomyces montanisoli TaxID=2798581 RepID=A0A940MGY0_9ACTN|nr:DUF5691 domain-containing protein [Streptomyces montanisoli]MBP0461014.1 hypothetical protein [Streptomyces montanisoli]
MTRTASAPAGVVAEAAATALAEGSNGPAAARWKDLVTSALLGTDRRTPPAEILAPGVDEPMALLDAAALHTVRRRAGLVPGPAAEGDLPEPAPLDGRPALPGAATHRLTLLLADRAAPSAGSNRRGTAPDLAELLPQWLAAANAHGYAAPAAALPALLDAARARTDLRPQALTFAGARGLWLARWNPDWKFALRGGAGSAALPDLTDEGAVGRLWDEGLFAERVALLSALRALDGARGRALLESTWATERAEDRLMFLDTLRTGLHDEDEPFLEASLSDRSRNVRSTAAELLSGLPHSALAARMADRATTCVALDRLAARPSIAVEAPYACDADMRRDGVTATPPTGRGERSWWLSQLVEAAPLDVWPGRLGGRTPAEIVALPVGDDWRDDLHAAWCRAAITQRDADWARALTAGATLSDRARLLAVLPSEERAARVASFIASDGLSEAFQLLAVCAVPWAEPLGGAVVDALDIAREAGSYPWSFSGVMGLAERCLSPDAADRLDLLTATPADTEDTSPGAGGYWSEAFRRLVATLRLRALIQEELAA